MSAFSTRPRRRGRGPTAVEPPNDAGYIISIHAPREGSDLAARAHPGVGGISIHAPREGSDFRFTSVYNKRRISIHAPREGSDTSQLSRPARHRRFLSTLPARGATTKQLLTSGARYYFYPRSPRGERRGKPAPADGHRPISIHAPREGSDGKAGAALGLGQDFYPRSPRGERQSKVLSGMPARRDFYPRSPRGERPSSTAAASRTWTFLSTLPARGATGGQRQHPAQPAISIHAPREGSDP